MRVAKAIDYYRFNIIKTSLESVRSTLSEARSMDPNHYNTKYDGLIAKHQAEHDVSPIVDDESIIFASLKIFLRIQTSQKIAEYCFFLRPPQNHQGDVCTAGRLKESLHL